MANYIWICIIISNSLMKYINCRVLSHLMAVSLKCHIQLKPKECNIRNRKHWDSLWLSYPLSILSRTSTLHVSYYNQWGACSGGQLACLSVFALNTEAVLVMQHGYMTIGVVAASSYTCSSICCIFNFSIGSWNRENLLKYSKVTTKSYYIKIHN